MDVINTVAQLLTKAGDAIVAHHSFSVRAKKPTAQGPSNPRIATNA